MAFPFSARTLGYLIDAITTGYSKTEIATLVLKAQVDIWYVEDKSTKEGRIQDLLHNLRHDTTKQAADAATELARLVLASGAPTLINGPTRWYQPLHDAVAADGLEFNATTHAFMPLVAGAPMQQETGWLGTELARRGWAVAAGHYEQAIDNFSSGNWAAANGQLRAFFESVVRTAGGTHAGTGAGQVQAAFDSLHVGGTLIADEAAFGKALWKMLHPAGSHPGLSDQDESRFRLLALTGYVRFLVSRLPG